MSDPISELALAVVKDPELSQLATARQAADVGMLLAARMAGLGPDQTLESYLQKVGPTAASSIECVGLQLLDAIADAGKKGVPILLYRHLVSGRWAGEAKQRDAGDDFRSYIRILLANPGRPDLEFKEKEIKRWTDTVLLVQLLYLQEPSGRYPWRVRLGIEDSDWPSDPEDAIARHGDRWGRAGYALLALMDKIQLAGPAYARLRKQVESGKLDPNGEAPNEQAYRMICRWRYLFGASLDTSIVGRALDHLVAGTEMRSIPPLVITEALTREQRNALARLPFVVLPQDDRPQLSEVRYRLERLPTCPRCKTLCIIKPDLDGKDSYLCFSCAASFSAPPPASDRWWVQWNTRNGMTPWHLTSAPSLEDWHPSLDAILGIPVLIYETWQPAEFITTLEEQHGQHSQHGQV